ncbi:hypothetical protein [Streptomyces sp. NPDC001435]|uniref:hypothetical protein n=1 Tax=unclassified Streptomyces TaxID=2593676 RepID=UPI003680019D
MGDGFFELPVDAELFQGGCLAASDAVKETALTGPGPKAVNLLIRRCGLAVSGR